VTTRAVRSQQTLAFQQDLLLTLKTGFSISFRLKLLIDLSYYGAESTTRWVLDWVLSRSRFNG
jgi:hypothetical protein